LTKYQRDNEYQTQIYQACVASIPLYGNETGTPYDRQEAKLNSFRLRCLRRILGITWQDRIPNTTVLEKPNVQACMLYSAKDICRTGKGRIPKDVIYGHPHLCFKDICKRDIKYELMVEYRSTWQHLVKEEIKHA